VTPSQWVALFLGAVAATTLLVAAVLAPDVWEAWKASLTRRDSDV
jgi:hypothetical protein